MKKFIFLVLTLILFLPFVNAEDNGKTYNVLHANYFDYNTLDFFVDDYDNSKSFIDSINFLKNAFKNSEYNPESYKYYFIYYPYSTGKDSYLYLIAFNEFTINFTNNSIDFHFDEGRRFSSSSSGLASVKLKKGQIEENFSLINNNLYRLIDTNYNFKVFNANYSIQDFYDDDIILTNGSIIPTYLNLLGFSSWGDYESKYNSNFITVDLDDYHYVLLSLKDYSKTTSFNSNLFVKGMVGITPIYNYGQTEKPVITDRCNLHYDDFTSVRFTVLENDLINNVVYAVKSCEKASSFRFDSRVFDVTYVTDENVNDPVVNVNGKEYHTIPFSSLSNSANKNEEEDFVPGASEELGKSFSDVFSKPFDFLKNVFNQLSSFFSLVTSFINFLPFELQSFLYLAFTVAIVLGIIKIIL